MPPGLSARSTTVQARGMTGILHGRGRTGRAGLHGRRAGALGEAVLDQPDRAAQRRNQTPDQRRRHIPNEAAALSAPRCSSRTMNGPSSEPAT